MFIIARIMKYMPSGQARNAIAVSREPPAAPQPPLQNSGIARRSRRGAPQQRPCFR